jgi:Tfp pilus assembly protein PilF
VTVRAAPLFVVLFAIVLACTVLQPYLASRDARTAVLIDKGRQELERKDYAGAEVLFEAAVNIDADDWETWWELGDARWHLGKHGQALDAFGKAESLHSLAPERREFLVKAREWFRESGTPRSK